MSPFPSSTVCSLSSYKTPAQLPVNDMAHPVKARKIISLFSQPRDPFPENLTDRKVKIRNNFFKRKYFWFLLLQAINHLNVLLHELYESHLENDPYLPDWMSHILPWESGSKILEKSSGLPMSNGLGWGRTKPADRDKAANQPRSINPTSANGLGTIPAPKYVILHNNVYFSLITLKLQEQIKKKHQIYLHRADLSIYSKSLQMLC